MKKLLLYLIPSLLLVSCGVKKHTTEATSVTADLVVETTQTDTLPDFLKEFANDSTIHINWVYGIPFIINDSVPMLLPPIDKNPEGYVSNKNYELIQRGANRGEEISICGIKNPVDSILWLNKCINDILYLKDSSLLPVSHYYTYSLFSYTLGENNDVLIFEVFFSPYWSCIADTTPRKQMGICYVLGCDGNLLGKMNVYEPVEWENVGAKQIGELDSFLPEAKEILSLLNKNGKRRMLLPLSFIKNDSNYNDCK